MRPVIEVVEFGAKDGTSFGKSVHGGRSYEFVRIGVELPGSGGRRKWTGNEGGAAGVVRGGAMRGCEGRGRRLWWWGQRSGLMGATVRTPRATPALGLRVRDRSAMAIDARAPAWWERPLNISKRLWWWGQRSGFVGATVLAPRATPALGLRVRDRAAMMVGPALRPHGSDRGRKRCRCQRSGLVGARRRVDRPWYEARGQAEHGLTGESSLRGRGAGGGAKAGTCGPLSSRRGWGASVEGVAADWLGGQAW